MRWKVTTSTVTGKAHTDPRRERARTTSRAGTIRLADTEFFIGIAADGAGSTTDGGRGAEIACETLYGLHHRHAAGQRGSLRITDRGHPQLDHGIPGSNCCGISEHAGSGCGNMPARSSVPLPATTGRSSSRSATARSWTATAGNTRPSSGRSRASTRTRRFLSRTNSISNHLHILHCGYLTGRDRALHRRPAEPRPLVLAEESPCRVLPAALRCAPEGPGQRVLAISPPS